MGSKSSKHAAKQAAKHMPVVRTVQALHGVLKLGELTNKAIELGDKANEFIPAMQVMAGSACDNFAIMTRFATIAGTIGLGASLLTAYQGIAAMQLIAARLKDIGDTLEAQTALMAQNLFPQYVYDLIQEGLITTSSDRNCSHWFFVYHPDNVWSPTFIKIMRNNKRLSRRFCGYTTQLDTLFVYMLAARREIVKIERRARRRGEFVRPVKFHVLIPAYQPVVITEFVSFPKEVGDFVIEGKIHKSKALVWLNVP
jgi:hypothetical protein